jgi:hypothetical protein
MPEEHDEVMQAIAEGDPLLQQALTNSKEQDENCNVAKMIDELEKLWEEYHNEIHTNRMVPCDDECSVTSFLNWISQNDN